MRWRRQLRQAQTPIVRGLLQGSGFVLGKLRYQALAPLAAALASAMYLQPQVRQRVRANLQIAFPQWDESALTATCRASCEHAIRTALEVLWFHANPSKLLEHVDISDANFQSTVSALRQRQSAVIFMSPHLGNWEIAGQIVAALGLPIHAVARRIRPPLPEDMITAMRSRFGMQLLPQRGAVRGMVRALHNHESVGILMDQTVRPHRGGVFLDFFGLPASTSRAPASLLRKCGGEVCAAACVREGEQLRLYSIKLPQPVAAYNCDLELTSALLKLNEQLIQRWPQQYMWNYERWRYIPPELAAARTRFPYYAKAYTPPETSPA